MHLRDIKSRVILVDFAPGSHGHFFVSLMNSLVQEDYSDPDYDNQKNFHHSKLIPPTIWEDQHIYASLDQVPVPSYVINQYDPAKVIFWGMHWSNRFGVTGALDNPNFRSHIAGYNLVELYFSRQSHEQFFINSIYNVGNIDRSLIQDPENLPTIFYQLALQIDQNIVTGVPTNRPWHITTVDEIRTLFETWLIRENHGSDNVYLPKAKRYLHNCDVHNPCVSFDVSYFYNYNMFVSMVEKVFGYYQLLVPIDYEFLRKQWDLMMGRQVTNNIRNKSVDDHELHPLQLAYRNYLRRFNAF